MARQIVMLVNRRAGSGHRQARISELQGVLEQRGYVVEPCSSIEQFANTVEERRDELVAVVAAGGDGTAEVAASHAAGSPVALFPMGTENLLAKYLGIAADPRRLADIIEGGETRTIDAGRAGGEVFLLMLSCGFDAEVVRRLHQTRQGNISHLSYAMPIIDSIRTYEYPNLVVEVEGDLGIERIECHWAFVFNAPTYAAGLQIIRSSDPSDGQLDVATFAGGSFWHGLWQFSAVVLGQHHQMPNFRIHRGRRVSIQSNSENVPFQIDGDPGGYLPIEIDVIPSYLTLLVPNGERRVFWPMVPPVKTGR